MNRQEDLAAQWTIIQSLSPNDEAYFAIVSSRRLAETEIPAVRVDALLSKDIKRLLIAVAQDEGLTLTPSQVNELTDYISGYPPSVYYAINKQWRRLRNRTCTRR